MNFPKRLEVSKHWWISFMWAAHWVCGLDPRLCGVKSFFDRFPARTWPLNCPSYDGPATCPVFRPRTHPVDEWAPSKQQKWQSHLFALLLNMKHSSGSNSQERPFVWWSTCLQMLRRLLHCWFSTSFWAWRRAAWCSVGAAGHPAGSCGASASVASCPAATQPALHASSAPAAARRARSAVWPRSPHTTRSTGPPAVPRTLMALIRMLPCQLFRKSSLVYTTNHLQMSFQVLDMQWWLTLDTHLLPGFELS